MTLEQDMILFEALGNSEDCMRCDCPGEENALVWNDSKHMYEVRCSHCGLVYYVDLPGYSDEDAAALEWIVAFMLQTGIAIDLHLRRGETNGCYHIACDMDAPFDCDPDIDGGASGDNPIATALVDAVLEEYVSVSTAETMPGTVLPNAEKKPRLKPALKAALEVRV